MIDRHDEAVAALGAAALEPNNGEAHLKPCLGYTFVGDDLAAKQQFSALQNIDSRAAESIRRLIHKR